MAYNFNLGDIMAQYSEKKRRDAALDAYRRHPEPYHIEAQPTDDAYTMPQFCAEPQIKPGRKYSNDPFKTYWR